MPRRRVGILANEFATPEGGETAKKIVVVVMDAESKVDFTALKWALASVVQDGDNVILLGARRWRTYLEKDTPLWEKCWLFDEMDLPTMKRSKNWASGKYNNIREVVDLCEQFGAKPEVQLTVGYPLKLYVLDRIVNLRASWVVFDRHFKKNKRYYQERIPSNVVMVVDETEVDILRTRSSFLGDTSIDTQQTPISSLVTPEVIIPSPWLNPVITTCNHIQKGGDDYVDVDYDGDDATASCMISVSFERPRSSSSVEMHATPPGMNCSHAPDEDALAPDE